MGGAVRIVLIGAGATGSVAAGHLARVPEVGDLVLADLAPERATALADRLGSRKARAVGMPGIDAGGLAKLVAGADLAINAAHAAIDLPLMDACLDAGAHYMDLSSCPSLQWAYDERFRRAGLTAFLGGGEDPGLGNVLARRGADLLDTVDSVRIRDGDTARSDLTPLPVVWSPETFLDEVFTEGLYFEDGRLVRMPPWSGREVYPFPEPVGPQPVYLMDHEEPETLPRFLGKGLRYVDLKLAIDDDTFAALRLLERLGLLRSETVRVAGVEVAPRDVLLRLLPRPTDLVGRVTGAAMIAVEVAGTKDGERATHRLWTGLTHEEAARRYGATATGYLVGTGAAIFAIQFARGHIPLGVISAECLDPAESLRLMAEFGLRVGHEVREGGMAGGPRTPERKDGGPLNVPTPRRP